LKKLVLAHLRNLRAVHMNAFSGLFKLLELDLSRCPLLESIDEHAFEQPNLLRSLNLSHNRLSRLSERLLDWDRLEALQLAGNPWNCDCDLLRFLPATVRRLQVPGVVCAKPEAVQGKAAAKLSATFCADLSDTAMSAVVVGALLMVISFLLCILACLRSRFSCCHPGGAKDDANCSRTPLYGRQALLDSLTYEKSDLLSNKCFLSSNPSPVGSQHDDEEYYSTVRTPTVYESKYAFYQQHLPVPVAPPMPPVVPPPN
uniref:LRRCT domain-containing protein n=1 Tax=Steinernema glaseri TaxID=37863 RepID=A0A1I8AG45_9BILA